MEVRALSEILETDLPGVGKKFTLATIEGETVTVIVHTSGRRDVYFSADEDGDEEPAMFKLTDEEARRLSAVLGDTFYKPTPMEALRSAMASKMMIEMVQVMKDAVAVGRSLQELDIRRETGVSVLAVQRGDKGIANPPASTRLEANDVLIVMGGTDEVKKLEKLIKK